MPKQYAGNTNTKKPAILRIYSLSGETGTCVNKLFPGCWAGRNGSWGKKERFPSWEGREMALELGFEGNEYLRHGSSCPCKEGHGDRRWDVMYEELQEGQFYGFQEFMKESNV